MLFKVLFMVKVGRHGNQHNLRFERRSAIELQAFAISLVYNQIFLTIISQNLYFIPAPTVLPPSLTAKLKPSSIAIGAIGSV